MKNKILIGGLVFVAMIAKPALANPGVEVVPSWHDFGEVELGSSSSTIITISNVGEPIYIDEVSLQAGSSPDFFITSAPAPGTELMLYESADVEVTYTPSAVGYTSAVLLIHWTNGESGIEHVSLEGVGVEAALPPVTIEDILAFFDESVIEGTLEGKGRGKSALARLFVLRKMIERAGKLIDRGRIRAACWKLLRAYRRCDRQPRPPDFVEGEAVPELASMIHYLRYTLGCN